MLKIRYTDGQGNTVELAPSNAGVAIDCDSTNTGPVIFDRKGAIRFATAILQATMEIEEPK